VFGKKHFLGLVWVDSELVGAGRHLLMLDFLSALDSAAGFVFRTEKSVF
jgi:hypothetical protein